MARQGNYALRLALFALAFVAAYAATNIPGAITQALIWLPTGVAIAGTWLLGWRSVWMVAACTLTHRLLFGYGTSLCLTAAIGSTIEAIVAVVLLRRLGARSDFARLQDVLVLLATAATAPFASILVSMLGRALLPDLANVPMASGLDGWWRMNALGTLTLVPTALVWLDAKATPTPRQHLLATLLLSLTAVALVTGIMTTVDPGMPAVLLLTMLLPIALYAALRLGQRGAAATATSGALTIITLAASGIGAFQAFPMAERHVVIQIFLVALVSVPLVFGALVAERDASASLWLESEGIRGALLKVLPDVMYKMSVDGTVLAAIVPPGQQLPLPAEQLIGRPIEEIATAEVASKLLQQIHRADRGEPTLPVEYPLSTPQGRRDREMRCVRLPNGELLGVVRDITARKLAERQLTWQASILERIAAGQPVSEVFPHLVDGLAMFLPEGMCSILLLRGTRLYNGYAPAVPPAFRELCEGIEIGPMVGSCGTAAHDNRTVVCSDIAIDPRWAAYRTLALANGILAAWSVPVRSTDGTVLGTFAIYHREPQTPTPAQIAVVERAAMLAGLGLDRERREALLASIQSNISEGLFRSVPSHGIVHANAALARMFGYDTPSALLQAVARAGNSSPHRDSLVRLGNETTSTSQVEMELCRRDGTRFCGLVSTTVVCDPAGTPITCDGTIADITARKELENQLRHAQKMEAVGQLAGGVAHDFNNLLTAISGYGEAVRDALPATDPVRSDVGEILKAADRAAGLTRQLLAFGRRQVLTPRIVDLVAVVREVGDMLRRVIGEQVTLATRHDVPSVSIRVDRGQLEQVLLNLVLNARDAMPAGGTVTIGTSVAEVDARSAAVHSDLVAGPHAVLWVADTGVGMSPEVRSRAFDPFFTTKELGKGTGLGLSTVYGIVHQSGGATWIDSGPGKGTTVWIYLPRLASAPDLEPTVRIPRPIAGVGTVLVVEDEELVRDLVKRALTRAGHTVLTAGDGEQALAVLADCRGAIDVVLSDVVMPKMGGRELLARMRQAWPRIPVLLMSGYANEAEGLATDRSLFLQKPFTAADLLATVGRLLAAPGHREATALPLPTSS